MIDADLLRQAAANIETEARKFYDRAMMTNVKNRRNLEEYARLSRLATDILALIPTAAIHKQVRSQIRPVACTKLQPCCSRRDEYNGFASGPTHFKCPKRCVCHD